MNHFVHVNNQAAKVYIVFLLGLFQVIAGVGQQTLQTTYNLNNFIHNSQQRKLSRAKKQLK